MDIAAEKKRLQTKLDKVQVKIAKENAKLEKTNTASQKSTNALIPLSHVKDILMAQLVVLDKVESRPAFLQNKA